MPRSFTQLGKAEPFFETMTVKELKDKLATYDENLAVILTWEGQTIELTPDKFSLEPTFGDTNELYINCNNY